MLAAVIVIVFLLFFLGMSLLISSNVLIIIIFAIIGLMVGGLLGTIVLRSHMHDVHWAIFIGPLGMGIIFLLSCAIVDLWVKDLVGFPIPFNATTRLRLYSSALFLGTLPGLGVGWLLGVTLGGRQNSRSSARSTHGRRQRERQIGEPTVQSPPQPPLPPPPPGPSPGISPPDSLLALVHSEYSSLTRFGQVQIMDPRDGSVYVRVTRYDGTIFYFICSINYPNQPPKVMVERSSMQLPIGSGIHFPWDSSMHRLSHVMQDLTSRV